jgi:hypothetical protein
MERDLDIHSALAALRNGRRLIRRAWQPIEGVQLSEWDLVHVVAYFPLTFDRGMTRPDWDSMLVMSEMRNGEHQVWCPTMSDVVAEDWYVLEVPTA